MFSFLCLSFIARSRAGGKAATVGEIKHSAAQAQRWRQQQQRWRIKCAWRCQWQRRQWAEYNEQRWRVATSHAQAFRQRQRGDHSQGMYKV